jgi:hypothetical protein
LIFLSKTLRFSFPKMAASDIMTLKRTAEQELTTDSKGYDAIRQSPAKTFDLPKTTKSLGEHSLASMMSSRRSGLHSLHTKFAEDMEKTRCVSFERSVEKQDLAEPPFKRRRFQRRNSKTASMLFSSMSSIVASGLGDAKEPTAEVSRSADDAWDGGLEIAEELVRQLKLRRQSLGNKDA